MKRKISFDPAWTIFLMVAGTLITMNFMDDEHSRNMLAGFVLLGCFLLFTISVSVRILSDKAAKQQL
ncbi:hypothetical protein [Mucilaginibacter sp. dw_454]|uniref:hypothetical protein n=1 Tax=Mucilaginibacter sp. dw_454 TaxID=2720079 RepID=UPI001BD300FB|nr:hypothetical protein [Mucilaginibacter sp. dw_454]